MEERELTIEKLKRIAPRAKMEILTNLVLYEDEMIKAEIVGQRKAYFLAQLAHESDGFRTTEEYASGRAYEGRDDLGNYEAGDGVRYKGRGLIQLTGRANYKMYGPLVGADLETYPELAAKFPFALLTGIEYWKKRGLNHYADRGDFPGITKRINGGLNGIDSRYKYLERVEAESIGQEEY